jgi:hypothetical protein
MWSYEQLIDFDGTLSNRVKQAYAIHKKQNNPIFVYFKGGAAHTPSDGSYTWEKKQEWLNSKSYVKSVYNGNKQLTEICNFIIKNDPQSILILVGDHGARLFRGAASPAQDKEQLYENIKQRGISVETFCNDLFGVFLAIRLPGGAEYDISQGMPMSHVNLFRHIFAYLNNDTAILETRVPSNSYYKNYILVEEGKIVLP